MQWCRCTRGAATVHYKGNEDGGDSGGVPACGDGLSQCGWCDDVVFMDVFDSCRENLDKLYAEKMAFQR